MRRWSRFHLTSRAMSIFPCLAVATWRIRSICSASTKGSKAVIRSALCTPSDTPLLKALPYIFYGKSLVVWKERGIVKRCPHSVQWRTQAHRLTRTLPRYSSAPLLLTGRRSHSSIYQFSDDARVCRLSVCLELILLVDCVTAPLLNTCMHAQGEAPLIYHETFKGLCNCQGYCKALDLLSERHA